MHIKSLVIDGFKSYGNRVELKDFDPEFNAITGLNGTGKSNILDSICFALGISTMNTIRASTMQDVIYKSGQAGVHTATVTLTFDNKDKSRSAPHYKHNDEIIISREVGMGSKNTYRINGVTVPVKKIMDFFNSLQMNVNNPHFIIMQGRITKVLNMKPIEILSMIEEAAGTNMYESKKKTLELTVGRKDNKLKEMRDVADEEILPTMESIDKEKRMLEELNMVQGQLRKTREKIDNWHYVTLNITVKKKFEELQSIKDVKQSKTDLISELLNNVSVMKKQLLEFNEKLEKNDKAVLNEFKVEADKMENEKNDLQRNVEACKASIDNEVKKIKDMEKQITKSKKDFEAKKKEIEDFNKLHADLNAEDEKNKKDLDEIEKKIRSLNSGNIFSDEVDGSVQDNIKMFNQELQKQKTENNLSDIKLEGLKNKLKDHLTGMEEAQKAYDLQMAQLTAKEKEYEKITNEFLKANEELSQYDTLKSNRNCLLRDIHDLNSTIESFEYNNYNLFFKYSDPRPNFDRRKVHGLVCSLFEPIDFKYELALTTLAGGRLYYIVIEDDTVGRDILESNKFPNRMNFIPLNKIKSDSLPPNVIRTAQQIGGADQVFPAMSLIKYDKKHLKAIQWVFGQSFICTSSQVAEKVCFDNRIHKNCYTLDGDHFNPSGSLTGGSVTQKLVLKKLAQHNEIVAQVQKKNAEFTQLDAKLSKMVNLPGKTTQLRDQQLTVQIELEKVKSDLQMGKSHQQVTEVNEIKQQINQLEITLAQGKINEKKLLDKVKALEKKMKNAKNILKEQLIDAEKTRNLIKSKIDSNKEENDKKKNNYEKLSLESQELAAQVKEDEDLLAELNGDKVKLEKDLLLCVSEFNKANEIYMKKSEEYECQKKINIKKNAEMDELSTHCKKLETEVDHTTIQVKQLEIDEKNKASELKGLQHQFDKLNTKLPNEQKEIAEKTDFANFNPGKIVYFNKQ